MDDLLRDDLLRCGDLTQQDPQFVLPREAVDHLLLGGRRMPQAALHLGIGQAGRDDVTAYTVGRHL